MKKSEIKVGEIYAVVTGSMYEGAENYADAGRILETGVEVSNFSTRRGWSRYPSSRTNDGVRVQLLDRRTLEPRKRLSSQGGLTDEDMIVVIKTRQIVATWEDHTETQREKAEREAQADARRKDVAAQLDTWVERLGIESYQLPNLSGGIGHQGFDETYSRNRAALVRVIELAYQLGQSEAV